MRGKNVVWLWGCRRVTASRLQGVRNMFRRLLARAGSLASGGVLLAMLSGGAGPAAASAVFVPLAVEAPDSPVVANATPACTSPAPVHTSKFFHCYTPAEIAAAYGVD